MEFGVLLFFIFLLIPGIWLILSVRQIIKQREWLDERQHIEQERISATAVRWRHPLRHSVQDDEGSPGKEVSPAMACTQQTLQAQAVVVAASGDLSETTAVDSWQDLNASQIGAAFESFMLSSTHTCVPLTTSQIDEAFEKFMV